jgi:hypothetical protein
VAAATLTVRGRAIAPPRAARFADAPPRESAAVVEMLALAAGSREPTVQFRTRIKKRGEETVEGTREVVLATMR